MLDAIGAGSTKRIGGDWGQKWRDSEELAEVKETIRQLNEETLAGNKDEVRFSTRREGIGAYVSRATTKSRSLLMRHPPGSSSRLFSTGVSTPLLRIGTS
jgi:hypothetical protein